MRLISSHRVSVFALSVVGVVASTAIARSENCTNTCVTMAIPRTTGVETKLDGTSDAVLWPPSEDLRTIRIAAENLRGAACDVTINDVRQDEPPAVTSDGVAIDDAVNCRNAGDSSSVDLRSDRACGTVARSPDSVRHHSCAAL